LGAGFASLNWCEALKSGKSSRNKKNDRTSNSCPGTLHRLQGGVVAGQNSGFHWPFCSGGQLALVFDPFLEIIF